MKLAFITLLLSLSIIPSLTLLHITNGERVVSRLTHYDEQLRMRSIMEAADHGGVR